VIVIALVSAVSIHPYLDAEVLDGSLLVVGLRLLLVRELTKALLARRPDSARTSRAEEEKRVSVAEVEFLTGEVAPSWERLVNGLSVLVVDAGLVSGRGGAGEGPVVLSSGHRPGLRERRVRDSGDDYQVADPGAKRKARV
jgi:hypothetical protein